MELVGGLAMMMSILFFFLSVIWFVLPFVIFAMKGKVDRSLVILETMEQRLAALEARSAATPPPVMGGVQSGPPHTPPGELPPPSG